MAVSLNQAAKDLEDKEQAVKDELIRPNHIVTNVEVAQDPLDDGTYGFEALVRTVDEETGEYFGRVSESGAVTVDYEIER